MGLDATARKLSDRCEDLERKETEFTKEREDLYEYISHLEADLQREQLDKVEAQKTVQEQAALAQRCVPRCNTKGRPTIWRQLPLLCYRLFISSTVCCVPSRVVVLFFWPLRWQEDLNTSRDTCRELEDKLVKMTQQRDQLKLEADEHIRKLSDQVSSASVDAELVQRLNEQLEHSRGDVGRAREEMLSFKSKFDDATAKATVLEEEITKLRSQSLESQSQIQKLQIEVTVFSIALVLFFCGVHPICSPSSRASFLPVACVLSSNHCYGLFFHPASWSMCGWCVCPHVLSTLPVLSCYGGHESEDFPGCGSRGGCLVVPLW